MFTQQQQRCNSIKQRCVYSIYEKRLVGTRENWPKIVRPTDVCSAAYLHPPQNIYIHAQYICIVSQLIFTFV